MTGSKQGGTISSFFNWVATGSAHVVSLLPRASSPESPWFAYFILELEQELIEDRTGLWKEVLRELAAASGKANVDQALKVCSGFLKSNWNYKIFATLNINFTRANFMSFCPQPMLNLTKEATQLPSGLLQMVDTELIFL